MTTDLNNPPSRKRKVFVVPYSTILSILFAAKKHSCVEVACPTNLPSTASVVSVYEDYRRNAFCFIVEDRSFEEVQEGFLAPEERVTWEAPEERVTWEVK